MGFNLIIFVSFVELLMFELFDKGILQNGKENQLMVLYDIIDTKNYKNDKITNIKMVI